MEKMLVVALYSSKQNIPAVGAAQDVRNQHSHELLLFPFDTTKTLDRKFVH